MMLEMCITVLSIIDAHYLIDVHPFLDVEQCCVICILAVMICRIFLVHGYDQ